MTQHKKYWFLTFDGTPTEAEITDEKQQELYRRRLSTQNVFQTKEEAERRRQSLINFFKR